MTRGKYGLLFLGLFLALGFLSFTDFFDAGSILLGGAFLYASYRRAENIGDNPLLTLLLLVPLVNLFYFFRLLLKP